MDHAVAQVRHAVRAADVEPLEVDVRDVVEQPLARAEHHRREVQPQLVDVPRGQVLAQGLRAARDRDVAVAGRRAGLVQRSRRSAITSSSTSRGPAPASRRCC
jgi:hypothetical protein